ncbi:MAG: hypothetical protein K4H23_02670 [Mollicutes bacterium PWAP]|nr:hypothetical protein [Mollicutes bacterium PWAP]
MENIIVFSVFGAIILFSFVFALIFILKSKKNSSFDIHNYKKTIMDRDIASKRSKNNQKEKKQLKLDKLVKKLDKKILYMEEIRKKDPLYNVKNKDGIIYESHKSFPSKSYSSKSEKK